jgi:hypothetical protein
MSSNSASDEVVVLAVDLADRGGRVVAEMLSEHVG